VPEGPEDEDSLAIDEAPWDETPVAAVEGRTAVVAKDEVMFGRNQSSWIPAVVPILGPDEFSSRVLPFTLTKPSFASTISLGRPMTRPMFDLVGSSGYQKATVSPRLMSAKPNL
jgi:hypothetical protein